MRGRRRLVWRILHRTRATTALRWGQGSGGEPLRDVFKEAIYSYLNTPVCWTFAIYSALRDLGCVEALRVDHKSVICRTKVTKILILVIIVKTYLQLMTKEIYFYTLGT